jgi:hypothetical protein
MSGTRPADGPRASSASRAATSSASTGWNLRPVGTGITGSLAICRATIRIRSWNWAARSVVQGRPESAMTRSASSLDPKYPNMARSMPLASGIRSAPTTEMFTRCGVPARDAARTRVRALSPSPFWLPAQFTMISVPATAASIPWPVSRSPTTNSIPSAASRPRLLSTRTLLPASRRRGTTRRPSVPVPPVTRMYDDMAPPLLVSSARPAACHIGRSGSVRDMTERAGQNVTERKCDRAKM